MADVILVHGIAQEQRSAAELGAEWLPSLIGGLENAGQAGLADHLQHEVGAGSLTVRMAFYGNQFLAADHQGLSPSPLNAAQEILAEELAMDLLRNAVDSPRPKDAGEARRAVAGLTRHTGDAQGIRRTAGRAIAALDRLPWFTRGGLSGLALVSRTLAQVTRYLADPAVRTYAVNQVIRHLDENTRVVIGHSLGSVVAYEALRRQRAASQPILVTLGSPLGLSAVNRQLERLPGYPVGVSRWVNLAAPDDIVAARADLLPVFGDNCPPNGRLDPTWLVDNGSEPHRASFYLTKQSCGRAVAEALGS